MKRSVLRVIFAGELRRLLRDRRAIFFAAVLPAILYPLLFLGMQELEDIAEETIEAREVLVALDLTRIDPDIAQRVHARLELETPIQIYDADAAELFEVPEVPLEPEADELRERKIVLEILDDGAHLVLTGEPHPVIASRTLFHLYYDIKDDLAREARQRAQNALQDLEAEISHDRRESILGEDPGFGLGLVTVDVATDSEASGAALGRLLPFLAIFVLLSGGSYAALATFAGEREGGTLETLLVQPVPAATIIRGKFLTVLVAGVATLVINFASLLGSVATGLGRLPGLQADVQGGGFQVAHLLAGLAYLPACVLMCAILCLVCGRARTFREGQLLVFPLMIGALLPTSLVLFPELELDYLIASIPLAGPALALRDALRGDLAPMALVAVFVSHSIFTWLVLAKLSGILDAERVLATKVPSADLERRRDLRRHALRFGFISILALYAVGGTLQAWSLVPGLVMTFWLVVPVLAYLCARGTAHRAGTVWYRELGLNLPAPHHLLGALLVTPALASLAKWFLPLQMELLPIPESAMAGGMLEAIFGNMGWPALFFCLAFSPGLWEEVLFRGAILSAMKRDMTPVRSVLWQALLFGAAHASIYRLVPTAFLGGLFAAFALRTRSIWPVVMMHMLYDAQLVFDEQLPWREADWAPYLPWLALPGLALLLLPRGKPARPN